MSKKIWLAGPSLLALAFVATPAWAQTDQDTSINKPTSRPAAEAEGVVIVVTATKRETELQETPLAITALGGAALDARGVDSAVDLAMFVPGANFSTNGGATSITIRGVGSDGLSQPKDDPSVAAHLDGVYLARPASLSSLLYDIERIEVLRGPQGTLYGRNATGGALNIITKQPSSRFEAKGDATYGNYNAIQLRGAINVPLADSLKFRASALYNKHDGYATQLNPAFDDGDDADDYGGRATLLWEPLSNLSVTLRANIFRSKAIGPTRTILDTRSLIGVRDANGAAYGGVTGAVIVNRCALGFAEACNNPRAIQTVFPEFQEIRSDTYSGTIEWELSDAFTFRSITGYTDFLQDKRSASRPFLPLDFNATFNFVTTSKAFSQELNLNYDTGGPLSLVVGAFYLHDKGKNFFDNIAANPQRVASIESDQLTTTKSFAGFGEANFRVTDALTLTGGIRYTKDKKDGDSATSVRIPFRAPLSIPLAAEAEFESTDFKIGADYKISENLFLYGNYSTAFKTGGVNTGVPVNLFYQPEKLKAFQAGFRSDLLDNRLRINFDAYHYNYRNPQISQVLGTSLETQNASSATVKGAELSVEARPVPGLFLGAQVSYAHSRYGPALISDIIDLNQFGQNVFGQIQIGGNQLRFTPEWTVSTSMAYTIPVSAMADLSGRIDLFWQDESFARAQNLEIDRIDEYAMLNASLRMNFAQGRYFVEVFGKNLTDETVISARFVNPLHLAEYRPPRTYGITVGFNLD